MNILRIIKKTVLVAAFGLVSLNAFAATNPQAQDIILDQLVDGVTDIIQAALTGDLDLNTDQVSCLFDLASNPDLGDLDPQDVVDQLEVCLSEPLQVIEE